MSAPVRIQFLNHASVKMVTDTVSIVTDPWLSGAIFNNGWKLLWESPDLFPVAADADFIWISHEHPDHFSPAFFRWVEKRKFRVLLQATRDRRVAQYLIDQGFDVTELADGAPAQVSPAESFVVGRTGLYDSWSVFTSNGRTILNINDCILKSERDLRRLKKRVGHVDVLLTQFSYAGWVGDKYDRALHDLAARRRLAVVRRQISCLEPTFVIPFASFSWYCHEENAYLPQSINRVNRVLDVCRDSGSIPVVLKPLETWEVGADHDNTRAVEFWEGAYNKVPAAPLVPVRTTLDVASLERQCDAFQRRVFSINSRAWMRVLAALPLIHLFQPLYLRLTDLDTTVRFSFFDVLQEVTPTREPDIELSSDSLAFVFANAFGFDTLMVNARFNATKTGFDRVLRNFAIGTLNTMGWAIGWSMFVLLVREFRLVRLVVEELDNVNPD